MDNTMSNTGDQDLSGLASSGSLSWFSKQKVDKVAEYGII
jgi:hypothetical protein